MCIRDRYNGHFQQNLSSLPKGIELLSNLEYLKQKDWTISQPDKSPFDLLNTAFMDNGTCIVVGQGIEITAPLRMLFISSGDQKLMTSPRVYIDLKRSSSITLLEQHVGECSGHLLNESMIINIDDNAGLDHVRIQNNSKTTINMGNLHVKQQRDSNYTFVQFAKGSELGRMNIFADLAGVGASSSINGLSLSNNSQHLDVNIVTNHHAPNCNSGQNFKSILKDFYLINSQEILCNIMQNNYYFIKQENADPTTLEFGLGSFAALSDYLSFEQKKFPLIENLYLYLTNNKKMVMKNIELELNNLIENDEIYKNDLYISTLMDINYHNHSL